jgi:microcystin-dependent protein
MSEPFLGEIKIISWNFPPKGWAFCNGQLLPINQNQALFSLFGTMYGGNGQTTFGIPDFRGRAPLHVGSGFTQGQSGGEESHTLNLSELASHNHIVSAVTSTPNQGSPVGNMLCDSGGGSYATVTNAAMAPQTVSPVGGNQPHANVQPYLCLNFIVALVGIFPSRN